MAEENKQTAEKKIETKKVDDLASPQREAPQHSEEARSKSEVEKKKTISKPLPVDKSEKKEDKKESDLEKLVHDKQTRQKAELQNT